MPGAIAMVADPKLQKAMAFIQANLGRFDLSAAFVARHVAVSRSVLYRLFEPQGGVACFIKRQRLLALRDALSSAAETDRVTTLATHCGFVSSSHATRSFREAFGVTPGEYRASCRAAYAVAAPCCIGGGDRMSC